MRIDRQAITSYEEYVGASGYIVTETDAFYTGEKQMYYLFDKIFNDDGNMLKFPSAVNVCSNIRTT